MFQSIFAKFEHGNNWSLLRKVSTEVKAGILTVCSGIIIVADRGLGGCVDPEGNGVTMRRGAEGGPDPPSGEQDKQLICSSGGGKTPMGEQGGQQDGSDATSKTHHAQST